jgi:cell division protein FtsB
LDAFVIVTAFAIDVALRGSLEEAASLIVILRLWRVFKIFEELSVGAQEQMETMSERVEQLEAEIVELKRKQMTVTQGQ